MVSTRELPLPVLDALPLGAHRLMAFTDEALVQACGVRVMFTGRMGGVSDGPFAELNLSPDVGDDPIAVKRNIRLACEAAYAEDAALVMLKQVHGTNIIDADAAMRVNEESGVDMVAGSASTLMEDAGVCERQEADGVVVSEAGIVALLLSADCPLIVVVSPSGRFVVAHVGWRGAIAGVASKAAMRLAQIDGCKTTDFNAYIGPHICPKCFEVSEDIAHRFADEFGPQSVPSRRHVNLEHAISVDLMRCGMSASRIVNADLCTRCHPQRLFSYRATGGICGRQGVLALRQKP